jgi:hypothetical protein
MPDNTWRSELQILAERRYGSARVDELAPAVEAMAQAIERVLAAPLDIADEPPDFGTVPIAPTPPELHR